MAKNKRKLSSAQKDKRNIYIAGLLKKSGIISKQAKLHSGHYISRGVLKKVKEYEAQAKLGYKAYPASKATVKAAQERGFQTIGGNRIIGPATATFRNRLKKGDVTGIKPVKGGFMEEVILPHTVYDMRSLVEQLKEGIDTLKLPNEQFAIKYKGWESYRAFMNTGQLLEYLQHYRGFEQSASLKPEELQEEFDALTILRLHPNDVRELIRGPMRRKEAWKKARMEAVARGEYVGTPVRRRGKSRLEKAYNMPQALGERYLEKMAAKDRAKRAAMTPAQLAEYREKARKRAKASRDRKKGK